MILERVASWVSGGGAYCLSLQNTGKHPSSKFIQNQNCFGLLINERGKGKYSPSLLFLPPLQLAVLYCTVLL